MAATSQHCVDVGAQDGHDEDGIWYAYCDGGGGLCVHALLYRAPYEGLSPGGEQEVWILCRMSA